MKFADGNDFRDIIIYIILVVAGLAANAFRNYSKRKQMEQQKDRGELYPDFPETEPEVDIDEEIFEQFPEYQDKPISETPYEPAEISDAAQPIIPEPAVQTIQYEPELDKPVSEVETMEESGSLSERENLFTLSDDDEIYANTIAQGDISSKEITDDSENVWIQDFDGKKAIIFSEIINPKYH
jgi:hypothetical protein